jgi:transcriptional regulator with XRE-family HTH domain
MTSAEILSANVRQLMQNKGWTQVALAERAQISQKTISNIVSANQPVTLDTLDRVAAAFGVAGHWLCIPLVDWPRAA